ncbi:MAG: nicotinate-nucleotide--dimethylbenzimidazole phosphoribosyltransferase, partial [Ilumatobacteraceae bacterium]
GSSTGDLVSAAALSRRQTQRLVDDGTAIGERLGADGLVALGEVGVGNTTVAAALAAALLGAEADEVVGIGSGASSPMLDRKRDVVIQALERSRRHGRLDDPIELLAALGGPEFALLCGVTLGAARAGGVVVLDGLATSVAAAVACRIDAAVSAHLIAGQRSSEAAHPRLLHHLGLEPLLDLRLRTGEGVGAVLATRLLLDGLAIRRRTAVTS